MGITEILRRIRLIAANKIKSSSHCRTQVIIAAHNCHKSATLLDRDPNSPIGLKYQTGRKALLKEKRTDIDLKVDKRDKNTEAIVDQSNSKDLESQKSVIPDGQVQGRREWRNCSLAIYVMYP